jgi:hypothetical protein
MYHREKTFYDYWMCVKSNLKALKQNNIWAGQLPYLAKEWRLWVRITRNFREIEGSWYGVQCTDIFECLETDRKTRHPFFHYFEIVWEQDEAENRSALRFMPEWQLLHM